MPVPDTKHILKMKTELHDLEMEVQQAQEKLPALALDAELGDSKQRDALQSQNTKIQQAMQRVEILKGAITEADKQFSIAMQAIEQKKRAEAAERASNLRIERIEAAAKIDNAIATLETAFQEYGELRLKLATEMRLAGLDSRGEIATALSRKLGQFMRWSAWNSAPNACEVLGIPYARADRRKSLEAFETEQVPDPIKLMNKMGERK